MKWASRINFATPAWSYQGSEEDAPVLEFCSIDCHGCSERLEVSRSFPQSHTMALDGETYGCSIKARWGSSLHLSRRPWAAWVAWFGVHGAAAADGRIKHDVLVAADDINLKVMPNQQSTPRMNFRVTMSLLEQAERPLTLRSNAYLVRFRTHTGRTAR